ncbi:MAG: AAA family ATPase [Rhodovibrio sp.]|nr:AAA family ATPase [Rhodovibrio sp.]
MYLEHYGLQHLPFQITPDVRFFFESHGHTRARATIIYGLSKNEGFVVVTGAVGAGKTTLLEHLLAGGRFQDAVVARINTTQLGAENLLELIAYRLGLPRIAATKAGLLRDLEAFLLATRAEGKRTLLIVDEVQNLSTESLEELRMLSNFQDAEHPLLQTLLVGQPEFRERLAGRDTEQIRQRVIASYHLAPLAPEDVPAYIAFRLKHAGYAGLPLFTPDALAEIAAETGGVPRKINRLCDRALLYGFLEDRHELDGAALAEVIQEMRAERLEADDPEPAVKPASASQRVREAAAELANAVLEPLELVDVVEPDDLMDAASAGPTEAETMPLDAAAAAGVAPDTAGPVEPGPVRPVLPAKPVLITMNGQPHGMASSAYAPDAVAVHQPRNGKHNGGGRCEPVGEPEPGLPGIPTDASDDGDLPHDPAALTRTVAALRAELADYKTKIARIVDVLGRDGGPQGGPHAGGGERR